MKRGNKLPVIAAIALIAAGCQAAGGPAPFLTKGAPSASPAAARSTVSPTTTATPFQVAAQPVQTAAATPIQVRPTSVKTTSPSLSPARPSPQLASTALPAGQPPRDLGISVLARGLSEPDDLYLAPDGSIYLSDVAAGTVERRSADGKLTLVVSGLSSPEGIVQLPDGSLVIAEQGKNRLVRFDPSTRRLAPFVTLSNPKNLLGVDGIALDNHLPQSPSIIIPDSPNGTLLRASLDGKQVSAIASGFDRPTGAWVESDGSILVADEDAGELIRLRPDGSRQVLSHETLADDVIEDNAGNIYVVSISEGDVHWIQSSTGKDTILVRGLSSPQGLCFDQAGSLVVTESGLHQVVRIQIRPNP